MTVADVDVAVGATGVLGEFNEAGVLDIADVHVAQRLTGLGAEVDESVALAVALAVRALRGGSVCVDLQTVAADSDRPELPWPEPASWLAAVRASTLAGEPPVPPTRQARRPRRSTVGRRAHRRCPARQHR